MSAKDLIRFRCSSLGYIMTDPKEKAKKEAGELGETAKVHCQDVYISAIYNRREEISNKFLDKGNEREEDAITLVSRINKIFYIKNSERLTNDFITGEPDLFLGKSVRDADETTDTKCSWSLHTFYRAKKGKLDKDYYWQGQGYMSLTGAKKHTLTYCLVNGTATAIDDEKRKLQWRMGVIDPSNPTPEYLAKAQQIEINHIFDIAGFIKENPHFNFDSDVSLWRYDIPKEERIHSIVIERDEAAIERIYERVKQCWKYIDTELLNLPVEQLLTQAA